MEYQPVVTPDNVNDYLNMLINQVFGILPMFEDNGMSDKLKSRITNVICKTNGFFLMMNFNSRDSLQILSLLHELENAEEHKKVRTCVLRICSLLGKLKVGEEHECS